MRSTVSGDSTWIKTLTKRNIILSLTVFKYECDARKSIAEHTCGYMDRRCVERLIIPNPFLICRNCSFVIVISLHARVLALSSQSIYSHLLSRGLRFSLYCTCAYDLLCRYNHRYNNIQSYPRGIDRTSQYSMHASSQRYSAV